MMLFAGPLAGWLGGRLGSRIPLLIGTSVAASSFIILLLFHDERLGIYAGSALLGLGIGFSFASMANLTVEAVHPTRTGVATGINTIMRTIGGSLGGQISATVLAAHVSPRPDCRARPGSSSRSRCRRARWRSRFAATIAIPKRLPYSPGARGRSELELGGQHGEPEDVAVADDASGDGRPDQLGDHQPLKVSR